MHLPEMKVLLQVALQGLLTGGVYALMAAGLTLIFGVMRVINIAHGAFLVLSAYISYWLFTLYGLDPVLSVVVSVPLFLVIGFLFQRYGLSRIKDDPGLVVLVTFALGLILEGVMGSLWKTTGRSVRTEYINEVLIIPFSEELTVRLPWVRIGGFVLAGVALAVLWALLRYSDTGRAIRATIQNPTAAQLVGVNIAQIQALTFGVGLATVAAGGALFSLIWTFNGSSHEEWISKMLSVIVLGGMGSLPGAFLAALIMGLAESVAAVTMSQYISPIVFYLILFLTLIFRPQGLLGARVREG
jgi:branched-chain amino acid transport system permease protein